MSFKNISTKFEHVNTIYFNASHKRGEVYKAVFDDVYIIEYYHIQDDGARLTLGNIEIMSKDRYEAFIMLQR